MKGQFVRNNNKAASRVYVKEARNGRTLAYFKLGFLLSISEWEQRITFPFPFPHFIALYSFIKSNSELYTGAFSSAGGE